MSKFVTGGDDLSGFLIDGKPAVKPAKVTKSLEEALADVKFEWIEE
jgi:hypothetical protein